MNTNSLSDFQSHFAALPASRNYVENLIGNTPLLAIHCHFKGSRRTVFAKAEHLNLSGSIKDRMAYHILQCAYRDGAIRKGDIIAEATSGNTGISFAAIGHAFGNPVHVFMPEWMSQERISLIKSYGAEVTLVSHEEGGFLGSIEMADAFRYEHGRVFLPHQFSNLANPEAHYETTAPEIWAQLAKAGFEPDAFVAGVGTGGTIMGCAAYFREKDPNIKVYPLEPAESPTLSTGHKVGSHRIQGISDEFIPPICDLKKLDEVISVSDGDSILMAQMLAKELGLAVGISSGANFLGALIALEKLGPEAVVATVLCDDNKKYLSTDLVREEPIKDGYLSPDVRLFGYQTIGRVTP
ncbi:MAG: cysteine synthase family protein [Blastocatellia bacterium]|nr:cysteine synthase family protein [Chloracidobacterium sp.]MBL8183424.1 cysteine synthase family protein [Blastocatellia bacterium]HRJ88218.1 cysteine synthase family protein [Pyrinomonadaceae bacterium]HRK49284.1 cysteine synthase family protein [Pyrinomonadaceae bacterium]